MKTLQQLYNENPTAYMQAAKQANEEQKILSVKDDALFLAEKPSLSSVQAELLARSIRNEKLAETDWTQLPDVNLSSALREKWKEYRQNLRDLPADPGFPQNIEWPEQP